MTDREAQPEGAGKIARLREELAQALADDPLAELLASQRNWSERTFGPGDRTASTVAHIRKELSEVEAAPTDTAEHVDLMLLAMDLYWRAGGCNLLEDLWAKHRVNQARQWQTGGDGVWEHVR